MELFKLGIIVCLLFQVSQVDNTDPYIVRTINGNIRYCIRIYNCRPGHQILPCDKNDTEDHCLSCQNGMVQPLLVSSSENMESTKCFKNKDKDKCMAYDVRARRNKRIGNKCNFNDYCECDTYHCYHGDPCACDRREKPCGIDETMNEKGDCIKCPVGMEKNKTGCEICTHIIHQKSTQAPFLPTSLASMTDSSIHNGGVTSVISKSLPKEPSEISTKDRTKSTKGPVNEQPKTQQTKQGDSQSSTAFIAIIAVLAVAVVVLLIHFLNNCKSKNTEIKGNGPTDVEAIKLLPIGSNRLNGNVNEDDENLQRIVIDKSVLGPNIEADNMTSGDVKKVSSSGQFNNPVNDLELSTAEIYIDGTEYDRNLLPNVIRVLINETDNPCKSGDSKLGDNNDDDQTKVMEVTPVNFHCKKSDDSSADTYYFIGNEDRNSNCLTEYKQLSKNCSPVTQVSDDGPLHSERDQDESIGSCMEYHNFTIKGYRNDLTSSTYAKTFSSNLPFSTCHQTNSVDFTESNKFGIPKTIAELSSKEQSINYDNSNTTCRLLDDVNYNKDTRDDSQNKIERQIEKSVEIRLQASSFGHHKHTRPDTGLTSSPDSRSSTFDDSGIRVANNSNEKKEE